MVPARYFLLSYVYIYLGTYLLGVVTSKGSSLWPTEICAEYPSRPLYQIGVACSILPHIIMLGLWFLKTRSRKLAASGISRFVFSTLAVYITSADSLQTNGLLGFLQAVSQTIWMVMVYYNAKGNASNMRYRKYLTAAYIFLFAISVHQLSRHLTAGYGIEEYKVLRGAALLIEIGYDYLSKNEFDGMELSIGWTESFQA